MLSAHSIGGCTVLAQTTGKGGKHTDNALGRETVRAPKRISLYGAGQLKSTAKLAGDRVVVHDAVVCFACWVTFPNATSYVTNRKSCSRDHESLADKRSRCQLRYTDIGQKGNPESKREQNERAGEKTIVRNHHQ